MRKKAEPRTRQHPKPSRAEASTKGLIDKGKNAPRSDREGCALDNRSHRTPRIRSAGRHQSLVVNRAELQSTTEPENMHRPVSTACTCSSKRLRGRGTSGLLQRTELARRVQRPSLTRSPPAPGTRGSWASSTNVLGAGTCLHRLWSSVAPCRVATRTLTPVAGPMHIGCTALAPDFRFPSASGTPRPSGSDARQRAASFRERVTRGPRHLSRLTCRIALLPHAPCSTLVSYSLLRPA
jgi:hypothetical protein